MRKVATAAAIAAGVMVLGAGSATAATLVTSSQIKDQTIQSRDIGEAGVGTSEVRDESLRVIDLAPGARTALEGEQGLPGQAGKDGKDGVTHLIAGAGYAGLDAHAEWAPHSYGETTETCPEGMYALGGGYSSWGGFNGTHDGYDLGGLNQDVQVTVSAPYFQGAYEPVDEAGNFRADQWVVRGYNHGDQPVDVRAWVVCADVN